MSRIPLFPRRCSLPQLLIRIGAIVLIGGGLAALGGACFEFHVYELRPLGTLLIGASFFGGIFFLSVCVQALTDVVHSWFSGSGGETIALYATLALIVGYVFYVVVIVSWVNPYGMY